MSEVIKINQSTTGPAVDSGKVLVTIKTTGVIQQTGKFVKEAYNN
jgi:hypothetical protein